MNTLIILLTALAPVAILALYIYYKDKESPEPTTLLLKAFALGLMTVPLSLCISIPSELIGLYSEGATSIIGSIRLSFFGAAIPEEAAKLFMLWLVLRNNRYFNEKMDGIVYAVFISLGFAALENAMYLFNNAEEYISVGISRAIFAVPAHFCFGILMGYYYSLAKFYPHSTNSNRCLVFLAPVIAHGIYDSILFASAVTPEISGLLTPLFLYFCYKMWKRGSQSITEHLLRDGIRDK